MKRRALMGVAAAAAMTLTAASADAATIKVSTIEDGFDADGKCALREAVEAASENKKEDGCAKGEAKRDTIVLKEADYQLSFITSNENENLNGDLDFTGGGPVTVLGQGKGKTAIVQNSDDRVVDVRNAGNVTLSKLRLGFGDVSGLGASEGRGGNARVSGGKLTIASSVVSSSDAVVGRGVYADQDAKLKLTKTEMTANDATVAGGAVGVQSGATATLNRTTISNVDATSATESVRGGILASDGGGLVKVVESTLQGSTATATGAGDQATGGGIYMSGDLLLTRSLVQGNTASAGSDNNAEHGGGLYVASGTVRVVNTTMFNNRAGGPGDNDGIGGAIYGGTGSVSVQHSTLDSNFATSVGDGVGQTGASVELLGSLFDDLTDPCYGTVSSAGYNVSEDDDAQGDCGFVGTDVRDVSTGLSGAPVDNGGPTLTLAIPGTSPAKDRVPTNLCKPATGRVDQRGFERPKGAKCDSGAFEFNANP